MGVTFRIPSYLAGFADSKTVVPVDGTQSTVRSALEALWRSHPALRDRLVDERGEVRQHVNIFVGEDAIRFAGGLDTPVPEGAEIMIVPAVSGG